MSRLGRRLVDGLIRGGKPGRELGQRIDLARSIGPMWSRRLDRDARGPDDSARDAVYGAIWAAAAASVGATVTVVSGALLDISHGGRTTRVWHNLVPLDEPVALQLAGDKPLTQRMLADADLPTSEHVVVDVGDIRPAEALLARIGGPVVVKPAAGTIRGHGITCGVRSSADLHRARLRAARHGDRLVVEAQATGIEYRLLVLDGEVLDAVRREPPRVVGDGRSTVGALVVAENRRRRNSAGAAGLFPLTVDLDLLFTLRAAGVRLRTVLPDGVGLVVKSAANENSPADNHSALDEVGAALRADAVRAATTLGLRLAGVEVVTPDPARSLANAGGVVLEVNGNPGLHYHYQVADPTGAVEVAVPLLRRLLDLPTTPATTRRKGRT